MLEAKHLMVFYENALALNDFSLEIKAGEIVAVIGSNSAGKTTLMNTISGLILDLQLKEKRKGGERITILGDVVFNDQMITHTSPDQRVKKGIVLCRERHPIFPESDVLENLRIAGYLRKRSEIEETIRFAFSLFPNLASMKNQKAGFLSGGEQQMLTISMALVVRPTLLLLDEPLLGLSPAMQTKLISAIKKIREETQVTLLISEQFARPLLPMIDRGYVIENGMLTLSGSGQELMSNPEIVSAYFGV
ncbi:MAG: ABC transporter ATP-binding protein [Desulfobacca sp.]|nr:ABC transporter ATP-binding protein [Desulfobacca sp.]